MPNDDGLLIRVVRTIPAVLGAGLTAAVQTQSGDPVTSAMVGEAFAQIGDDFVERVLSPRQSERVATTLDFAVNEIRDRIDAGEAVRDDGFFDVPNGDATEVFEGVLLAARDEHQHKKLPYIAHLLAEVAFDSDLTGNAANLAIREAERLSWVEMCLLSIVARPQEFPLPDTELGVTGSNWGEWSVSQTFHELHEDRGMLYAPRYIGVHGMEMFDLKMSSETLTNLARLLVGRMRLGTIPVSDLHDIYEALILTAQMLDAQRADKDAGREP